MTFLHRVLAVAIAGCVLLAAPAGRAAAVDYFLKIEGIDGESKAQGHQNWLEVTSIAWGRGAPQSIAEGGMAGRSGAGEARSASGPGQMTITKTVDKASPKLMQAMASGRHIASAQLDLAKPGAPAMRYNFQNVIISSFKQTAGQGGRPVEQFTINFEKVEITRLGGPGGPAPIKPGVTTLGPQKPGTPPGVKTPVPPIKQQPVQQQ